MKVIFLHITFLLAISCSQSKNEPYSELCKPVQHIEIHNLSNWPGQYNARLNTLAFRPKLLWFKKKYWFAFLSSDKKSLRLFNMNMPQHIDSLLLPAGIKFNFICSRDSLFYFINRAGHKMASYVLQNDSLSYVSTFDIPYIEAEKKYWLSNQFYEVPDFTKPKALLHFGLMEATKTQYMDPAANFMLLAPGENKAQKIGHYPSDYFDEKRYYSDALFASDGKGNIYYTHQLHDSIYKINEQGSILAANSLEKNIYFLKFSERKEMDMAYIRQYSLLTEMNTYIYCLNNNTVVLIKKLAKDNLKNKTGYKYFVLDNNLNIKYTDTVRHSLYPMFISDYKNGFMLLGDSLKAAYYYEIH